MRSLWFNFNKLKSVFFFASIIGQHSSGCPLVRTWNGNDEKGIPGAGRQPGVEGFHQNQQRAAGIFGQRQQDSAG